MCVCTKPRKPSENYQQPVALCFHDSKECYDRSQDFSAILDQPDMESTYNFMIASGQGHLVQYLYSYDETPPGYARIGYTSQAQTVSTTPAPVSTTPAPVSTTPVSTAPPNAVGVFHTEWKAGYDKSYDFSQVGAQNMIDFFLSQQPHTVWMTSYAETPDDYATIGYDAPPPYAAVAHTGWKQAFARTYDFTRLGVKDMRSFYLTNLPAGTVRYLKNYAETPPDYTTFGYTSPNTPLPSTVPPTTAPPVTTSPVTPLPVPTETVAPGWMAVCFDQQKQCVEKSAFQSMFGKPATNTNIQSVAASNSTTVRILTSPEQTPSDYSTIGYARPTVPPTTPPPTTPPTTTPPLPTETVPPGWMAVCLARPKQCLEKSTFQTIFGKPATATNIQWVASVNDTTAQIITTPEDTPVNYSTLGYSRPTAPPTTAPPPTTVPPSTTPPAPFLGVCLDKYKQCFSRDEFFSSFGGRSVTPANIQWVSDQYQTTASTINSPDDTPYGYIAVGYKGPPTLAPTPAPTTPAPTTPAPTVPPGVVGVLHTGWKKGYASTYDYTKLGFPNMLSFYNEYAPQRTVRWMTSFNETPDDFAIFGYNLDVPYVAVAHSDWKQAYAKTFDFRPLGHPDMRSFYVANVSNGVVKYLRTYDETPIGYQTFGYIGPTSPPTTPPPTTPPPPSTTPPSTTPPSTTPPSTTPPSTTPPPTTPPPFLGVCLDRYKQCYSRDKFTSTFGGKQATPENFQWVSNQYQTAIRTIDAADQTPYGYSTLGYSFTHTPTPSPYVAVCMDNWRQCYDKSYDFAKTFNLKNMDEFYQAYPKLARYLSSYDQTPRGYQTFGYTYTHPPTDAPTSRPSPYVAVCMTNWKHCYDKSFDFQKTFGMADMETFYNAYRPLKFANYISSYSEVPSDYTVFGRSSV
jgi:hypothetical protein